MTLIIFLISVVLSKILADSLVPTEMNVKSHRIIDENAKLAGKYTFNIFQMIKWAIFNDCQWATRLG